MVATLATVNTGDTGGLASSLAQAGGGGTAQLIGFIPYLLIFVVFYFILIRPQQQKQKAAQQELENWLRDLKKGDEVVTSGGLIGKITGLADGIVTLELQEKVRVRVLRTHLTGRPPGTSGTGPAAPAAPPPPGENQPSK